jgi:hypothetical protein
MVVRRRGSPHYLDSRPTDGGEVSLKRRPAALYTHDEPWCSFREVESTPGP